MWGPIDPRARHVVHCMCGADDCLASSLRRVKNRPGLLTEVRAFS